MRKLDGGPDLHRSGGSFPRPAGDGGAVAWPPALVGAVTVPPAPAPLAEWVAVAAGAGGRIVVLGTGVADARGD